jgi:hypothetical protein
MFLFRIMEINRARSVFACRRWGLRHCGLGGFLLVLLDPFGLFGDSAEIVLTVIGLVESGTLEDYTYLADQFLRISARTLWTAVFLLLAYCMLTLENIPARLALILVDWHLCYILMNARLPFGSYQSNIPPKAVLISSPILYRSTRLQHPEARRSEPAGLSCRILAQDPPFHGNRFQ